MNLKTHSKKGKLCKGAGKAKGHGCGEKIHFHTYGLGRECGCFNKWCLNTQEGNDLINKTALNATKYSRDLKEAEKEKKYEKKVSSILKKCETNFNTYIRLRDEGKCCPSCGEHLKKGYYDAGHFYPVKFSLLRFHEYNVHGQCEQCNRYKRGNVENYRIGLRERIGEDKLKVIDDLAEFHNRTNHKWDIENLEQINKYSLSRIKELKQFKRSL